MKMKKTVIVLAVLTAALFAVSCQKEDNPETTGFAPMTINAVSEGIGVPTKTEMIYKYDIAWQTGDEILVKGASNSATFTLAGGAGTTKGTFSCNASPFQEGDAVEAFYPESIVDGEKLVWPASLTNNQTVPMYSTKTLSATVDETFNFASLGSVFQLIFSTESTGVVLESIEIKADEAMSGEFTISNGQAVMPTDGDKPGIKLDLGETGVALGVAAKKFNIAIPSGTYNNLTIILTANDGRECEIKAKSAQTIAYNTVSTLTLSKAFGDAPIEPEEDALPGLFSISENKHVQFSKGNLYCKRSGSEGSYSYSFAFEDKQWEYHTRYGVTHTTNNQSTVVDPVNVNVTVPGLRYEENASGLFQWVVGSAIDASTDEKASFGAFSALPPDEFKLREGDAVEFGNAMGPYWSALNFEEWAYLIGYDFNKWDVTEDGGRPNAIELFRDGVTVNGVLGSIIAPDDWNRIDYPIVGDDSPSSYDASTWSEMESMGLVFLPYAGMYWPADERHSETVSYFGEDGHYWLNTSNFDDNEAWTFCVYYSGSYVSYYSCDYGLSIRLAYRVD